MLLAYVVPKVVFHTSIAPWNPWDVLGVSTRFQAREMDMRCSRVKGTATKVPGVQEKTAGRSNVVAF